MKEFDLIVKNGVIVTAEGINHGDIGIKGEKILRVGQNLADFGCEILDAGGKYVFPGGIDVHTHLDMPCGKITSVDDFSSGTIAAACGGTTTIIDFATQEKGQSLAEAIEIWHGKAEGQAVIDYGFHIAISDLNDQVLGEIPKLIAAGYQSFKLYMTYEALRVDDGELLKAFKQVGTYGGLVSVHAENHFMIDYLVKQFYAAGKREPMYHAMSRPPLVEAEAVGRAIKLAQLVNAPLYIVHLSCREALAEVLKARNLGLSVMAETCPQYLTLTEDCYREPEFEGAKYVMSPPLRSLEDQNAIWEGLSLGEIQTVATDHCPFNFKGQKELGREFFADIPNGAPGIELRMALVYAYGVGSGKLSLQRFVEVTATNPAKIFGLYPQKGHIAPGCDADLVIFDQNIRRVVSKSMLHEQVDYTPYEGLELIGYPITTIARGQVVVKDGKYIGRSGYGVFLPRHSPQFI